MTASYSSGGVRWYIDFDRIGRDYFVKPLEIPLTDPHTGAEVTAFDISEAVNGYVGDRLISQDVEIVLSLKSGKGEIRCGVKSGGRFTVKQTTDWALYDKCRHPADNGCGAEPGQPCWDKRSHSDDASRTWYPRLTKFRPCARRPRIKAAA